MPSKAREQKPSGCQYAHQAREQKKLQDKILDVVTQYGGESANLGVQKTTLISQLALRERGER